MAYEISGPVDLGTTGQQTQILGDVSLNDVTTAQGAIVYSGAGPQFNLTELLIGTAGDVLTVAGGVPTWAPNSAGDAGYGFMMKKNGNTLYNTSPAVINGWATTGTGCFDTSTTLGTLNITNGTFTVSKAGKYQINVGITFSQASNAGSRQIDVYNGTNIIASTTFQPSGGLSFDQHSGIAINAQLAVSDVIQVRIRFTVTPSVTVKDGEVTWFGISYLKA